MNKSEKEILYSKICQVEKLLEEYETYLINNNKRFLRRHNILRIFCGSGLLISFGLFAFAVFYIIFGGYKSVSGYIISLISICFSIGVFIMVVAMSAFYLNSKDYYINNQEYAIYKNNKCAFTLIGEIKFPLDYICSGFAKTVREELKKDTAKELEEVYIKCRSVKFDIANDLSAQYINTNRNYIFKIKNYMGIIWWSNIVIGFNFY